MACRAATPARMVSSCAATRGHPASGNVGTASAARRGLMRTAVALRVCVLIAASAGVGEWWSKPQHVAASLCDWDLIGGTADSHPLRQNAL